MKKEEIRFYVQEGKKAKLKIEAIKAGKSLSQYVYDLIKEAVPEDVDIFTGREMMQRQLDDIVNQLNNSSSLSNEERQKLEHKKRRTN